MTPTNGLQIPPPSNWQDFETLCCELWAAIWKDPYTMKNGRLGQAQHGIDIFGRPKEQVSWAGVQCKGKDAYSYERLTEVELLAEVEKAKLFEPKLAQFLIATTGPKDAKLEERARVITQELQKQGLFSVDVFGWADIVNLLNRHLDVLERYYPEFTSTKSLVRVMSRGLCEISLD